MNPTPLTSEAASGSAPLRILLSDPHLKGGGQVRYVVNLARELTGLGHHVTIGCKTDSILAGLAREAGCPALNAFHYRGGLRPLAWSHDLVQVRRFIQEERPHILHANGSQDHWVSALACRTLGHPTCMVRTRHNTYLVSENAANRMLNLSWTDYQIAVCEAVFDLRASRPVFDSRRMTVIHNGVDPDVFKPDAGQRRRAREEFGYGDEDVVLGIAARLTEAKGHRFLFEAVAGMRSEFPQLRLLILGQGDLEAELKQLAEKLDIAPIATFAGFRTDIAQCIQAFDIGVQPSIDCEASSFSVMEQMATEIPIVASDHGGTKEIVRDGVDGYIVPQGTVKPLADALARLLGDAALRRQMGASSRRRIMDEFTLALLAQRTVDAYRKALAAHASRRAGPP
ncbi:MAG: glycosyltransferase family 4 protein [Candidatus Hydrogenedentes bacterium]|nr:glycosyltransferase family 4 protein [Candidatus Hydrogenedentota bacterium]